MLVISGFSRLSLWAVVEFLLFFSVHPLSLSHFQVHQTGQIQVMLWLTLSEMSLFCPLVWEPVSHYSVFLFSSNYSGLTRKEMIIIPYL